MKDIYNYAIEYYNLGFKITYINPKENDPLKKKIYKAPSNNRIKLKNKRQLFEEIKSFNWGNATGVGTVLGFNKLRALDVDFLSKYKLNGESKKIDIYPLIIEILNLLNLPKDYEWVVRTPSNGFHIIFYCENHNYEVPINPISDFKEKKTKAFKPNSTTLKKFPHLGHFELRWDLHLVLPPSIDKEGNEYIFINSTSLPLDKPKKIEIDNLYTLIREKCYDVDLESNRRGYNLFLDEYHRKHNYIDYSEILIKN